MPCLAVRRVLDDSVADEVDEATLTQLEVHVARCADCRFALAQARTFRRMMRIVGQRERAPSSLRERAIELLRGP